MTIGELLFLSDTDTTLGFLSRSAARLDRAKERPSSKPYITVYPSLASMGRRHRIPTAFRKRVRRSRRQSFITPRGRSFRVVKDPRHLLLLKRLEWAYSSSANLSGRAYDEAYARSAADVVVEPLGRPGTPSQILRLGRRRVRRVR